MDHKEILAAAIKILTPRAVQEVEDLLILEDGEERALEYIDNRITWDLENGTINIGQANDYLKILGLPQYT
jgi:hypothetical protein